MEQLWSDGFQITTISSDFQQRQNSNFRVEGVSWGLGEAKQLLPTIVV